MKFAVIPARGGSKRIARKNIKPFAGVPMIVHSIRAAQASGLFEAIIVSTDDAQIAEVARAHGAQTPFVRPAALADDVTGTTAVIAHATQWLVDTHGLDRIDAVCCLYATAPFVLAQDLVRGWQALDAGDWAYAFSVTEFAAPIFRSFKADAAGGLEMFFPEHFATRSQDLPCALHDAGQFYWGRPAAWLQQQRIFDAHSAPVMLPRWRVQDIDTPDDWTRAELMYAAWPRTATTAHAAQAGDAPPGALLTARRARESDSADIFAWRNRPDVLMQSTRRAPLDWQTHVLWFAAAMADPSRAILIGEVDGVACGVLRYDIQASQATVSIYLAPGVGGRGLGTQLLQRGQEWLAAHRPEVVELLAEIRDGNQASLALFRKAGFLLENLVFRKAI